MNLPVFFVRLSKLSLLTDALSVHRSSLCSSMISASEFSSIKREISSIKLSASALCGTIAATPMTII